MLMKRTHHFTAIIEKEDDSFIALCPEIDVASQGDTVEEAKRNLLEAVELFLEYASDNEIKERLKQEIFITSLDVAVG